MLYDLARRNSAFRLQVVFVVGTMGGRTQQRIAATFLVTLRAILQRNEALCVSGHCQDATAIRGHVDEACQDITVRSS